MPRQLIAGLNRQPQSLRVGEIIFNFGIKTAGVQAINKSVIKPAGNRNDAIFQFSPRQGGYRRAHVVFRMGHGAEVQPRQTTGAKEIFLFHDKR